MPQKLLLITGEQVIAESRHEAERLIDENGMILYNEIMDTRLEFSGGV
jgi:hypothetical protein